MLIRVALVLLGILSTMIMLSFMAPQKTEWLVGKLGMEETAETMGLITSKNGTRGWTRTVLASGTQSVRRFLGSGGRRM